MRAVINTDYRVYSVYCVNLGPVELQFGFAFGISAHGGRGSALYNVQRTSRVSCVV